MITITTLEEASEKAVTDLNILVAELREDHGEQTPGSFSELRDMVANTDTVIGVAKDGDRIVGVALLCVVQKIGKRIAYVEDVVVSSEYRGQGLGEKIMKHLIEEARARGVRSIGLSSRPVRIAGNKLYQKLGFTQKITNVYRLRLQ